MFHTNYWFLPLEQFLIITTKLVYQSLLLKLVLNNQFLYKLIVILNLLAFV